jgi:foldase protein PrsA
VADGGDFAALAKENSLDTTTKDKGGEAGWVPRGALGASVEELIFGMDVGALSTIPVPSGVLLVEMEEKAESREIDETQKPALASTAFETWALEKRGGLKIVNNMDFTSGDADKINWAVKRAYQS